MIELNYWIVTELEFFYARIMVLLIYLDYKLYTTMNSFFFFFYQSSKYTLTGNLCFLLLSLKFILYYRYECIFYILFFLLYINIYSQTCCSIVAAKMIYKEKNKKYLRNEKDI